MLTNLDVFENCHSRLVFLEQYLATMNIDNIPNEEQSLLFAEELEELGWDEKDWYKIDFIYNITNFWANPFLCLCLRTILQYLYR